MSLSDNEASQLLVVDGQICSGKELSSRRRGVLESERGGCASGQTSATLKITGYDHSSIRSSPEAVGFYAFSQPQGSRREGRVPSRWLRRSP